MRHLVHLVFCILVVGCGNSSVYKASAANQRSGVVSGSSDGTLPPFDQGQGNSQNSGSPAIINISGDWVFLSSSYTWTQHISDSMIGSAFGTISGYQGVNGGPTNPNYGATISLSRDASDPSLFHSTGTQWYSPGGCQETYYGTYRVVSETVVHVALVASNGACGAPTDYHLEYDMHKASP